MKILQLNNYARIRGGSDRYFHDLSVALSHEHEVMMFGTFPLNGKENIPNKNLFYEDLPSELNVDGHKLMDALKYFWRLDVKKKLEKCINSFKPD